jgi:hypothetical protein
VATEQTLRAGILVVGTLLIGGCPSESGTPTDGPRPIDAASSDQAAPGREAAAPRDAALFDAAPFDAAHPSDGKLPTSDAGTTSCTQDSQCGANKGCLAGICRDTCVLGLFCLNAASGTQCVQGKCVQCTDDTHCAGNRYQCSKQSYTCVQRAFDPSFTKIGVFYSLWHCPAANASTIYNITKILAGQQSWGPLYGWHYWDQPAAGYYCLSNSTAVVTQHAQLLASAKVDFVFLDVTNHQYVGAGSDNTPGMILQPLDKLLAVWSTVPGAPRIVAWVPVEKDTADASKYTVDAIISRFQTYPQMQLIYQGKPLLLVTENVEHPVSAVRLASLAATHTVRKMWAVYGSTGPNWSFMEWCQNDPTSGKPCLQRSAVLNGSIEQISIAAAYQKTYMNLPSATPKNQGLTLRKQLETLFNNPLAPIATITGWNEWIAQRMPCGQNPTCPCATYPQGCFMDQYDGERSRDLEPAANAMGDYYYRLLKACIALFRSGALCDSAHAANLCCKAYTP